VFFQPHEPQTRGRNRFERAVFEVSSISVPYSGIIIYFRSMVKTAARSCAVRTRACLGRAGGSHAEVRCRLGTARCLDKLSLAPRMTHARAYVGLVVLRKIRRAAKVCG
jgi:hypothetical protein